MQLKSYAKINLSLDILGCRPDGYHNILSLMQNIGIFDIVKIEKCSKNGTKYNVFHCSVSNVDVYLCSSVCTIPINKNNLAIRGAKAILEHLSNIKVNHDIKELCIDIDKKLPIAAGIAGGSGNAAVTMLAINALAGYPLSLREVMNVGTSVGADVPFSIIMNAKMNEDTLHDLKGIEEASVAARMTGIGDVVEPVTPIHRYIIMANPGIKVSTKAAYEAIDELQEYSDSTGLFTNQLEKYTLNNYPKAKQLKDLMVEKLNAETVLMSGSGPTMVAYYQDKQQAQDDYERMKRDGWLEPNVSVWISETGIR